MTGLREALAGYLDLRRGLGFKLARDEKLLEQFIGWLEDRGTTTVTVADALAWATLPADASRGWLRMRITVVVPRCSSQPVNCSSSFSSRASLKPRPRRRSR